VPRDKLIEFKKKNDEIHLSIGDSFCWVLVMGLVVVGVLMLVTLDGGNPDHAIDRITSLFRAH
jgi:hypothetical protein